MNLFPAPQSLKANEGIHVIPDNPEILEIPVQMEDNLAPEEYILEIQPDGIRIRAGSDRGAFYAGETLNQIRAQSGNSLPCLEIHDWPDFAARGLMLDISRCKVPTMEALLDLVDWMASIKLNQLQLYIEHTFAFPGHDVVWENASPVTGEEIRSLDAYCSERFIELVPNFNSFGHMERWLMHGPYKHLAECPDGFYSPVHRKQFTYGTTLYPDKEAAEFVASLYDSYLPHFRSSQFNIGGDEPWELGRGRSAEAVKELGKGRVYLNFLKEIHRMVTERNHKMMCWADIIMDHPEIIPELPDDMIPVIWGYNASHPFKEHCPLVAKHSAQYYVAPGNNTWNSLTGRLDEAIGNMNNAARNGHQYGAFGYLITTWGDNGNHQPWITILPGILQGACSGWAVEKNENPDLEAYFGKYYFANPEMGEYLIRMGRIEDCLPLPYPDHPSGRSPTHLYLFLEGELLEKYLGEAGSIPSEAALREFITDCSALESEIASCETTTDVFAKSEMLIGLTMARLGARRAGILLHGWKESAWSDDLQAVRQEYRRVWLLRAREGGLEESMEYFPGP